MSNHMQVGDSWSATAKAYASDSIIKIPEYFAEVAAGLLLKDVPADGAVRFLDVAAGVGTLASSVLSKLSAEQKEYSTFDITDFSPGMVEKSESEIAKIDVDNKVAKKFQVMDGQALTFPDHTFSHLGCQFGIMFFPDRAKGLSEMYRVLQLDGTAAILTWHYVDNMPLMLEFAEYIKVTNLEASTENMNKVLSACGEAATFEAELAAVGFRDITVTKVDQTFSLPHNEEFFLAYASNPGMKPFMGGEDKFPEWQEFFRTVGSKWVNADGRISLRFVANLAIAKK